MPLVEDQPEHATLGELARISLKLGFTAFGGPAAHIAMLHDETVVRRTWTTEQHFLDMLGVTNLIPGPNSTEMVIHTGYEHQGRRGLIDWLTVLLAVVSAVLLIRYRINSAWLVLCGGIIGLAAAYIGGWGIGPS